MTQTAPNEILEPLQTRFRISIIEIYLIFGACHLVLIANTKQRNNAISLGVV
jgi:hypothetical protein